MRRLRQTFDAVPSPPGVTKYFASRRVDEDVSQSSCTHAILDDAARDPLARPRCAIAVVIVLLILPF